MKRLFGNLKMSWLSVILFAVVTGVYTGLIMSFPALDNTSFQDIGISYEWWVIFAVIVVVNCNKSWDAMLKCFVFFLLSQPIIYAVEVLCGHLTAELGLYYYKSIWLPITLLTLPGGFIAYFCQKQNLFGAVILGLGNTIEAVMGAHYLSETISSFPHHILSCIVCFGSIFIMSYAIQRSKKYRSVSLILPFVLLAATLVLLKLSGRVI